MTDGDMMIKVKQLMRKLGQEVVSRHDLASARRQALEQTLTSRAYEKILRNFNHDIKGMVATIQGLTWDLQDESVTTEKLSEKLPLLNQLTNHISMSLSMCQLRCESESVFEAPQMRRIEVNLEDVIRDVLSLTPEVALRVCTTAPDATFMLTDPVVWHSLVYQTVRNATTHGEAPFSVTLYDDRIEFLNRAGRNHGMLLSAPSAIDACLSGALGTQVSSGLGLQHVRFLCKWIGSSHEMTVSENSVLVTCSIPTDHRVSKGPASQSTRPTAILYVDDQKLLRRQAFRFYNECGGTFAKPAAQARIPDCPRARR